MGSISSWRQGAGVCVVLLSLFTATVAQPASPHLRVTWKNTVITVKSGDRSIAIPMPEKIANYDAAVTVLFVRQTEASLYLLFEIKGPSGEPGHEEGHCGGGTEEGIFLVEITSNWRLGHTQSIQTESCWENIETERFDRKYDVKNETLTLEVSDYGNNTTHLVQYDNHHPEQGLQIQERSLR
jgi:hypothetical protein